MTLTGQSEASIRVTFPRSESEEHLHSEVVSLPEHLIGVAVKKRKSLKIFRIAPEDISILGKGELHPWQIVCIKNNAKYFRLQLYDSKNFYIALEDY